MRKIPFLAVAILSLAVPALALAQSESAAESVPHHVAWAFDPVHSTMQVAPQASIVVPGRLTASTTSPAKTYTGTIDVVFTVKLISAQIEGESLRCGANVLLEYQVAQELGSSLVVNIGTPNSSESVDATISSGTATCKFSIPYSWTVPASTTANPVTIQGITGSVAIAADEVNSSGVVVRTYRSVSGALEGPSTIPADGTTTTLTASTVL